MRQRTAAMVGGAAAGLALVVIGAFVVRQGPPVACSASLYVPSVSIVLSGDTSLVRGVELCSTAACSFGSGPTASPTPATEPDDGSTAAPGSSVPVYAYQVDKHHWGVAVPHDRPSLARIAVRGEGGRILVAKSFPLEWKQVGATSVCGNAHTTPPVYLRLPSA
jgi:hypothetical protein